MKTTLKTLAFSGLLLLTQACSKDDDDMIKVQEHDQNKMMGIMHTMEDKMMAMQMSMDPDDDFAMMMKMHHQEAIDMANAELQEGDDPQMKEMAQKIIDEQKSEINELQSFLDSHKNPEKNYDPAKKDEGFGKVMAENMNMMMDMPNMDQSSSVDEQFVQMMIF